MITLTREEAQQVLDALKHLCAHTTAIKGYDGHKVQPPINMLKAKLKQPKNSFNPDWDAMAVMVEEQQRMAKRIEGLEAQLAQPDVPETAFGETEPVAWMHNFIDDVIIKNRPTDITCNAGRWTALYTAPPQREWVGLTDEEMFAALVQVDPLTKRLAPGFEYFARAIEAKLKEKNG